MFLYFYRNMRRRKLWMERCWGECLTVRVGPRWDHTLRERDMGHTPGPDTPQTPISLSGSALIYSPISINLNLFRLENHVKIRDVKVCTFSVVVFSSSGCYVGSDRLKNLPDTFLQSGLLRIAWREQIINRLEASHLAIALFDVKVTNVAGLKV